MRHFKAPLKITGSLEITDAVLTGSSVPENEHAAYSATDTYAAGDRRIYKHAIYESLQADNVGKNPVDELGLWWGFVAPTNRWAPFDLSPTTRLQVNGPQWYEFTAPSALSKLGFVKCQGIASVRVIVTTAGVQTHNKLYTFKPKLSAPSWYAWYYQRRAPSNSLVIADLPIRAGSVLRVELTPQSGGGSVGTLLIGRLYQVGVGVRWGVSLERLDFSTRQENPYTGDLTLKSRPPAKRMSFVVELDNDTFDAADRILDSLVGRPCLFELPGSLASLTQWAVLADSKQVAAYYDVGELDITVRSFV